MSRYKPVPKPSNPDYAKSWVQRFIRDTRSEKLGLVTGVVGESTELRLEVRFAGERVPRLVALEEGVNGEDYILPDDMHARYRVATDEDLAKARAGQAAPDPTKRSPARRRAAPSVV